MGDMDPWEPRSLVIQLENNQASSKVHVHRSNSSPDSVQMGLGAGQRTGLHFQGPKVSILPSAVKLVHSWEYVYVRSVNCSSPFCATKTNETKPTEPELTHTGLLLRAEAEVDKANPKGLRSQTERPCPSLPYPEAPTMELHLVIVSKVYLYCLFQSIYPS